MWARGIEERKQGIPRESLQLSIHIFIFLLQGHFTTKLGYKMNQGAYPVQQATTVMERGT